MGTKVDDGEKKRDHMARVAVTDSVWAEFKQAAHRRRVPVTEYLGALMDREVTRLRAVAAREESLSVTEAVAALAEVRSLTDELADIAHRLEWAAQWGRSDEEVAAMRAEQQARWTAVYTAPSAAEVGAMTDDQLIALAGKKSPAPAKAEPLPDDWMVRPTGKGPADIDPAVLPDCKPW